MKPARLDHIRATDLAHAVALLAEHADSARVLAGGQSLVPLLATRRISPELLVDINGLRELEYVREDGDGLEIGALTRNRTIETSTLVAAATPLMVQALHHSGHVTIRNRSTIGGSTAYAHPAGESPAALLVLNASVVLHGPNGVRIVPVAEFFLGPHVTAARPDELLTAVRIPRPAPDTAVAIEEFARRHGDFAIAAVLAAVRHDADGRITDARIGLGGVGPTPLRATAAEQLLVGQIPTEDLLAEAAGSPIDPRAPTPADWREYVRRRTGRSAPELMTEGRPAEFSPFESGYDPADPIDRMIMATRNAVFPLHGLMPLP